MPPFSSYVMKTAVSFHDTDVNSVWMMSSTTCPPMPGRSDGPSSDVSSTSSPITSETSGRVPFWMSPINPHFRSE